MIDSKTLLDSTVARISQIVLGKETQVRLSLACILARGHLLVEDIPGLGKTTLAHTLAVALGLGFQRIQFTSDMLPADILGVSIFEHEKSSFSFHPGPIFSQLVLADEVNRATPKAQSALLEAMEEQQITVDGETHKLPDPFFVIATQNPLHFIGTFPLPESQLDRFLMRIEMGYPDRQAERALLGGSLRRDLLQTLEAAISIEQLKELQQQASEVHVSDNLLDYLQSLLDYTRTAPVYQAGLSPRAGLSLLAAARAWALMAGRQHVLPEDIQAIIPGVAAHRLHARDSHGSDTPADLVAHLLDAVPVPA